MNTHVIVAILMTIGIVSGILLFAGVTLMIGYAISTREEWAQRHGRHTRKAQLLAQAEYDEYSARHRLETPLEKSKREMREEKEKLARADSFFDEYYAEGFTDTGEMPSLAYNLPTVEAHLYYRLMEEMDDNNIMQVANEGL